MFATRLVSAAAEAMASRLPMGRARDSRPSRSQASLDARSAASSRARAEATLESRARDVVAPPPGRRLIGRGGAGTEARADAGPIVRQPTERLARARARRIIQAQSESREVVDMIHNPG